VRVDSGEVRPLLQVAALACQGQVREVIQSAVLPGLNVLDVMGKGTVMLGKKTIFATELRSNSDPIPDLASDH
jgi:hypothetical protein